VVTVIESPSSSVYKSEKFCWAGMVNNVLTNIRKVSNSGLHILVEFSRLHGERAAKKARKGKRPRITNVDSRAILRISFPRDSLNTNMVESGMCGLRRRLRGNGCAARSLLGNGVRKSRGTQSTSFANYDVSGILSGNL
jgi:hypothetical protein